MAYSYLDPVNPAYKDKQDPSLKHLCYTVAWGFQAYGTPLEVSEKSEQPQQASQTCLWYRDKSGACSSVVDPSHWQKIVVVGSLILNLVSLPMRGQGSQQSRSLKAQTLNKHSGIDLSPGAVLIALLWLQLDDQAEGLLDFYIAALTPCNSHTCYFPVTSSSILPLSSCISCVAPWLLSVAEAQVWFHYFQNLTPEAFHETVFHGT